MKIIEIRGDGDLEGLRIEWKARNENLCNINLHPTLYDEAKRIVTAVNQRDILVECVEALKTVLAISDRKHDAWDAAKAALAKLENAK